MAEQLGITDYILAIAFPILLWLTWWAWKRTRGATISTSEWRLRMKEQGLGTK